MKTFLTTSFFLLYSFIIAQETEFRKVDYKAIEKEIKNKNSEYYYSTLMDRFQKIDTTLTVEHMYHLYYGSTLQPNYDPYDFIEKNKTVEKIEKNTNVPTSEEVQILKKFYTDIYKTKPFTDLRNIETLAIIYSFEENEEKIKSLLHIFYKLIDTLLTTGDGFTKETAIDVINTRSEYNLMQLFEVDIENQALTHDKGGSYDILKGKTKESKEVELYFDVTRLFEINQLKFKNLK